MDTTPQAPKSCGCQSNDGDTSACNAAAAREGNEPSLAPAQPATIFMFLVFAAVLLFGGNYLGKLSGGFSYDQYVLPGYVPQPAPGMEGVVVARPWIDDYMATGKKQYAVCAACHGSKGEGNAATNIPPLAGSDWPTGDTEKFAMIILNGLQGPITVNGKVYNNVMPAQGAGMTPENLGAVMTYVRRSFGNDASIVTPDMAKAAIDIYTARAAAGKGAVTADELLKNHAKMLPGPDVDPKTGKALAGAAPAPAAK